MLLEARSQRVSERQRRCIVSGEVKETRNLVRFVVAPGGAVVPDVAERLPGRGIWLSASREMVGAACAKGLFAKAARAKVSVADDLADQTETLLARRCLDLLGLARRAGQAALGFEKVRTLISAGGAILLIAARDGADNGKAKLRGLGKGLPVVELFASAELSLAFGRENVIHAALAPGRLADRFLTETVRLAEFRPAAA
ncbi:MAG: RNA-binding protein [Alphaproteobacteria bacterium]|nr:RNA-binding protein [Alphaproteobacteria bacterium]